MFAMSSSVGGSGGSGGSGGAGPDSPSNGGSVGAAVASSSISISSGSGSTVRSRTTMLPVNLDAAAMANDPLRDLFEACKTGDIVKVKSLITTQTVNARDTAGRKSTPLHFAAGECYKPNNHICHQPLMRDFLFQATVVVMWSSSC